MLKLGRYGVGFGPVIWFQTHVPTRAWNFLWLWFAREARPHDIDRKKQFPIGTTMEYKGVRYHYYRSVRPQHKGDAYMGEVQ